MSKSVYHVHSVHYVHDPYGIEFWSTPMATVALSLAEGPPGQVTCSFVFAFEFAKN